MLKLGLQKMAYTSFISKGFPTLEYTRSQTISWDIFETDQHTELKGLKRCLIWYLNKKVSFGQENIPQSILGI